MNQPTANQPTKFTRREFDRLYAMMRDGRAGYVRARANSRKAETDDLKTYWRMEMSVWLDQMSRAAACLHVDCRDEAARLTK